MPSSPEPEGRSINRKSFGRYLMAVAKAFASIRFTVVLFVLSIVLIFFGTVAQKHFDIRRVLDEYFYTWVASVDLNLISDITETFLGGIRLADKGSTFSVPFPGGFLLGWLMVLNLSAAHLVRFKMRWNRAGVIVTHLGILILLGGEYRRATEAEEYRLSGFEGETVDRIVSFDEVELVFRKVTGTLPASKDKGGAGEAVKNDADKRLIEEVVAVPGQRLAVKNAVIDAPEVPAVVTVRRYMRHAVPPRPLKFGEAPQGNAGIARGVVLESAKEYSSAGGAGRVNRPALIAELKDRNGTELGTYLFGVSLLSPERVMIGGTEYFVQLRMREVILPYTVTVDQCEMTTYANTSKARHYASTVTVRRTAGESFSTYIWMNHPMQLDGMTFYQASMDKDEDRGTMWTQLQVVKNPASWWPYISCTMIGLGMLVHFLMRLVMFLLKRAG